MSDGNLVWSAEQLKERYGIFFNSSPRVHLDRRNVPEKYWALLPYAEFWGIADSSTRMDLIDRAPADVRRNLKQVVGASDDMLEEWMLAPDTDTLNPTDEYVAFAAMIMAADYIPPLGSAN